MEIRVFPYRIGKTSYTAPKKMETTQQLKYLNDTVSFRGQDINMDNLPQTTLYQLDTLKESLDTTAAKEENIIKKQLANFILNASNIPLQMKLDKLNFLDYHHTVSASGNTDSDTILNRVSRGNKVYYELNINDKNKQKIIFDGDNVLIKDNANISNKNRIQDIKSALDKLFYSQLSQTANNILKTHLNKLYSDDIRDAYMWEKFNRCYPVTTFVLEETNTGKQAVIKTIQNNTRHKLLDAENNIKIKYYPEDKSSEVFFDLGKSKIHTFHDSTGKLIKYGIIDVTKETEFTLNPDTTIKQKTEIERENKTNLCTNEKEYEYFSNGQLKRIKETKKLPDIKNPQNSNSTRIHSHYISDEKIYDENSNLKEHNIKEFGEYDLDLDNDYQETLMHIEYDDDGNIKTKQLSGLVKVSSVNISTCRLPEINLDNPDNILTIHRDDKYHEIKNGKKVKRTDEDREFIKYNVVYYPDGKTPKSIECRDNNGCWEKRTFKKTFYPTGQLRSEEYPHNKIEYLPDGSVF